MKLKCKSKVPIQNHFGEIKEGEILTIDYISEHRLDSGINIYLIGEYDKIHRISYSLFEKFFEILEEPEINSNKNLVNNTNLDISQIRI